MTNFTSQTLFELTNIVCDERLLPYIHFLNWGKSVFTSPLYAIWDLFNVQIKVTLVRFNTDKNCSLFQLLISNKYIAVTKISVMWLWRCTLNKYVIVIQNSQYDNHFWIDPRNTCRVKVVFVVIKTLADMYPDGFLYFIFSINVSIIFI